MHFAPLITRLLVAMTLAGAAHRCAWGDVWREDVHGEIPADGGSPPLLKIFHPDNNYIIASAGGGDVDIITIKVPDFHMLNTVSVYSYSGATQSFVGLQSGTTWTAGTGGAINPSSLLGWTHFGTTAPGAAVGDNILDDLSTPKDGSAGFTPPLLPGFYTMLIQDTGATIDYVLQFALTYNSKPYGDFLTDIQINHQDLARWRTNYGPSTLADADGDGDSDGNDFLVWQRNVGRTGLTLTAVPEPATGIVAAAGFATLLAARRRLAARARHRDHAG